MTTRPEVGSFSLSSFAHIHVARRDQLHARDRAGRDCGRRRASVWRLARFADDADQRLGRGIIDALIGDHAAAPWQRLRRPAPRSPAPALPERPERDRERGRDAPYRRRSTGASARPRFISLRSRSRSPGAARSVLAWRSSINRRIAVMSLSGPSVSSAAQMNCLHCSGMPREWRRKASIMSEPDIKAYGDSWYAATMVDAPPRPPLSLDLDVDVCVIGGGLAGLTTAREVARSGWSVVLLEAGRLAAERVRPQYRFRAAGFWRRRRQARSRASGSTAPRICGRWRRPGSIMSATPIRAEAAPGIDPQNGWLYVSKKDNSDEFVQLRRAARRTGLRDRRLADRARARGAAQRALLSRHQLSAGDHRSIRSITRWRLRPPPNATARASSSIRRRCRSIRPACANASSRLARGCAPTMSCCAAMCSSARLMPRVAADACADDDLCDHHGAARRRLGEAVGYRGGVSDTDLADNHYRIVGGDRLMLSGRSTAWTRRSAPLRRGADRRYQEDLSAARRRHGRLCVAGTLGITMHRMPQIGELGPGVWLASGFGGHGLNTTAMAGNIIARAIVEGDQTWRQFTPFELVWAGGLLGRAAAQTRVWIKRLRDRIEERRAKARELAHRQARDAEIGASGATGRSRAEPGGADSEAWPEAARNSSDGFGPASKSRLPRPIHCPRHSARAEAPRRSKRAGATAAGEPAEAQDAVARSGSRRRSQRTAPIEAAQAVSARCRGTNRQQVRRNSPFGISPPSPSHVCAMIDVDLGKPAGVRWPCR